MLDLLPLALNCGLLEFKCAILLFISLHLQKDGCLSIYMKFTSEIQEKRELITQLIPGLWNTSLLNTKHFNLFIHSRRGQACAVTHGSELSSAYVSFSH